MGCLQVGFLLFRVKWFVCPRKKDIGSTSTVQGVIDISVSETRPKAAELGCLINKNCRTPAVGPALKDLLS